MPERSARRQNSEINLGNYRNIKVSTRNLNRSRKNTASATTIPMIITHANSDF